jgi:hypothetical protein
MGQKRGNGQNGGNYYSNATMPVALDIQFTVDSANGNGFGCRSVKSNGYVENVFMHTSATPGVGANGFTNPNPASGLVLVQFKNNYNVYLSGSAGAVSYVQTPTKIDNSALTIGTAYVITTLGNATLANWQSIGLFQGVTPAVGVPFIATAIGVPGEANTSTSRVTVSKPSGVFKFESLGDSKLTANSALYPNAGMYVVVQMFDATNTLVAPGDGTVLAMRFNFDASSVTIDGL